MRAYEFINEANDEIEEDNADVLVGSGRGGSTKKPGKMSADHKKWAPPNTAYSKQGKAYKTGATDYSVG